MQKINKDLIMLHLLVFIWGWTPILGKLITLEALALVWFRIVITVLVIGLYIFFWKKHNKISYFNVLKLAGVGCIIALHWIFFYHAIKISNVAIALTAFSTGAFFTSLIEPLLYKRKLILYELFFGLVIVAAILLIFKLEFKYAAGICFGILAAFTSSLFTVLNGILVRTLEPSIISFYELSGGLILLSMYLFFSSGFNEGFFCVSNSDWFFLFVLSIAATAFPLIASTKLLKKLNPYTVSLTVNLETVYSIVFAYFIWHNEERMTIDFYCAALLILMVIFTNGYIRSRVKRK